MKKLIAVFFLLIFGLVVLLATVDLEPYLSSGPSDIPKDVSLPPLQGKNEPPAKADTNGQAETQSTVILTQKQNISQPHNLQQGDLLESREPALAEEVITIRQEHTATPLPAKVYDDFELGQTSSSLLEMEITVLPVGEYPFSILLETFLKRESAQQAIFTYQERGISAYWTKVNLGNEIIRYRLFTGVFSTAAEAQLYLERHKLAGKLVRPTNYSARVGVYQNKPQLITDFIKTREAGVTPYIISTQGGDYYLYVGAFYTLAGATSQCRYLAEAGMNCKPVRRSTIPPQQP